MLCNLEIVVGEPGQPLLDLGRKFLLTSQFRFPFHGFDSRRNLVRRRNRDAKNPALPDVAPKALEERILLLDAQEPWYESEEPP